MANMGDITFSLASSNSGETLSEIATWSELQAEFNQQTNVYLDSIDKTLIELWMSFTDWFESAERNRQLEALNATDPADVSSPLASKTEDKKDTFSLADFFKTLAAKLVQFVSVILPAIIAALGLGNLGFTGFELKALDRVKAFFSGEWWKSKAEAISKFFRENKAVIAIKEFFGEGGKGGKFATYIDEITKPLRAFFSLEGEGLIAKTFQGIKGFGGKIFAVFGKIFAPISLLMSAFDGWKEGANQFEESGMVGGVIGFISGFVASFIGTFADLIKDGVMWLISKAFGIELNEDGSFDATKNPLLAAIDDVDIAGEMLKFGRAVTGWITGFFDDIAEWWDNFSLMDFITGGGDEEALKSSMVTTRGQRKMETKSEIYAEEAGTKAANASTAGTTAVVNAPTTNNTSSSSATYITPLPNARDEDNKRKRSRGGG